MKFVTHTDAPRATPADIDRIWRQLWGDRKRMSKIAELYTYRGEILDCAVDTGKSRSDVMMSAEYREITEQIRIVESITFDNQEEYFRQAREIEADNDWINDAWADYETWKDHKRTEEDARP